MIERFGVKNTLLRDKSRRFIDDTKKIIPIIQEAP